MLHSSRARGRRALVALTLTTALVATPAAADPGRDTPAAPSLSAPSAPSAPPAPASDPTDQAPPTPQLGRLATGTPAEAATGRAIDALDRSAVAAAYNDWFTPAYEVPFSWTGGSIEDCRRGTLGSEFRAASLEVVNYLRAQAGIGPVTFDAGYDQAAQEAALIMDANNALSHGPPKTWRCWSELGNSGAGRSNLALGWSDMRPLVEGYMSDPGDNNASVGHRTWILHPRVRTMGVGATPRAHALHVIAPDHWEGTVEAPAGLVTWPTAGYFPRPLIPDSQRWSVHAFPESSLDVSLADVTVQVTPPGGGAALRADVEYQDDQVLVFGNPWAETGEGDQHLRVTLANLTDRAGRPLPDHSYTVALVDPAQSSDYVWTEPPTVTGTGRIGEPLTASPGTYTPADGDETVSYTWFRDGKEVGTGPTYVPGEADSGLVLRVQVKVTGARGESATSVPGPMVERLPGPRALTLPEVYGDPYPGGSLWTIEGDWDEPVERYTYHWLRDGEPIGVTVPWYEPTADDVGHDLAAVVTAYSAVDGESAEATSAPVRVVPAEEVTRLVQGPTIPDVIRVGDTVRTTAPQWSRPVTAVTYRWFSSTGQVGEGRELTVPPALLGEYLTMQVDAVDEDGTPVIATAYTDEVLRGLPPTSSKTLKLRGKPKVGRTLRAVTGRWTPAETTVRYRWFRDGRRIKGVDGRRHVLVKRDRGHRISVRVTATLAGHERTRLRSDPTRVVRR